jgi:hypothetical protein
MENLRAAAARNKIAASFVTSVGAAGLGRSRGPGGVAGRSLQANGERKYLRALLS